MDIKRINPISGGLFAVWDVNGLIVGVMPREKGYAVVCASLGVEWGVGSGCHAANSALNILLSAIAAGRNDFPENLRKDNVFWDEKFTDWIATIERIETNNVRVQNDLELQIARLWAAGQMSLM